MRNRQFFATRTWMVALVVAGLPLVGCGVEPGDELDLEGDTEETTAPIINGSTDLTDYFNEAQRMVVLRNAGVGDCSATVLRPNLVLTAAHCVMTTPTVKGDAQTPSKLSVNGVPGIDSYVSSGWVDAALVLFGSEVVDQWEDFTALDPYPSSKHLGVDEPMTGYGKDENGVAGTLRVGTVTPFAVDQWRYPSTGGQEIATVANNPTAGTASGSGDSGGARWGVSTIYPRPVAGVISLGGGGPFAETVFAQIADSRYQFRYWVYDHAADPGIDVGFDSLSDLQDNFQDLQIGSGGPPNWQVINSALVQVANAPRTFQVQRGTFENFVASMYVKSSDDDTVGIAFRYVDHDNHYRCEANRAGRFLRIIRRRDGVEGVLTSQTWNGTFDGVMTASSTEKRHSCSFGNQTVSVTSSAFPIGKLAIYDDFNKGAKILWWSSAQLPPVDQTW